MIEHSPLSQLRAVPRYGLSLEVILISVSLKEFFLLEEILSFAINHVLLGFGKYSKMGPMLLM